MKYPHSIPKDSAPVIPTIYSKGFILENYGCYTENKALELPYDEKGNISIEDLKESIPIKDFCWFLINRVFDTDQQKWFALDCAKFVLPVFEKAYPYDNRVAKCIAAIESYAAAAAAYDAAADADTAYYAAADDDAYAAAAAYAAYDAVYAVYNAAAAADAAADAADAFPSFVQSWISPYLDDA